MFFLLELQLLSTLTQLKINSAMTITNGRECEIEIIFSGFDTHIYLQSIKQMETKISWPKQPLDTMPNVQRPVLAQKTEHLAQHQHLTRRSFFWPSQASKRTVARSLPQQNSSFHATNRQKKGNAGEHARACSHVFRPRFHGCPRLPSTRVTRGPHHRHAWHPAANALKNASTWISFGVNC